MIAFWANQDMTFGGQGIPQPVLNILGNVSSVNGVRSLRYSLNGSASHTLSVGPDRHRLARPGDFNIDISSDSLVQWPQVNTVTVTATDSLGGTSSTIVHVTNLAPSRWPLPFELTWSSSTSLQDSAQVTDGNWSWTPWGIMSAETGYDRLVAIGDTGWTDYQVQAELTVLEVDSSDTAYDEVNGGPAFGLILHWNGHTDTPVFSPPVTQPRSGYLPYGAIGCYHWRRDATSRWELMGNNLRLMAEDSIRGIDFGVVTILKMRVSTLPGIGQAYYLKHWKKTDPEPLGWQLVGLEDTTNPRHGSLLLYAHHVKGVFGRVSVEPLGPEIVVTNIESLPGPNSAYVTWKTNARSTGRLLYGKNLASPDTAVGDTGLSIVHQVLLPGLNASTQYQLKVEAQTEEGTAIDPLQGALTTGANQPPLAFKSDKFDSSAIDNTRWVFINPDPPSSLSLMQNQSTRALSIDVPAGSGHDIWSGINAPRIMQPAADMDFQAEAKFLSLPSSQYQLEGILVEQDENNYIRFDFFSDAIGVSAFTATFAAGVPVVQGKVQTATQSPLFLRVTRSGNLWKSFFSHDSLNWTLASSFTSAMKLNAIGLYSGNAPGSNSIAPAFKGVIDQIVNLVEKASDVPPASTQLALSFGLEQNWPNPFNPRTVISSQLPVISDVRLVIYDLLGREVKVLADERRAAGHYDDIFDASGLASGVYIYRLTAGSYVESRKMVLLK